LSGKIVSITDTHVPIAEELARWCDGHIVSSAIDAQRKMLFWHPPQDRRTLNIDLRWLSQPA